jgi:hypothetical protein
MIYKQIRQLVYDYGRRQQSKFPGRWTDNKTAGIGWLQGFMKRDRKLNASQARKYKSVQGHRVQ